MKTRTATNNDTLRANVLAAEADECAAREAAEENHRRALAAEEVALLARDRVRLAAETAEKEHRASVAAAIDREREWSDDQTAARWTKVESARSLRDQNEVRARLARAAVEGADADHAAVAERTRLARVALRDAEDAIRNSAAERVRNAERAVALNALAALERIGKEQMGNFGPALTVHIASCATVPPGVNPLSSTRGAETVRYAFEFAGACAQTAWTHMGATSTRERRRYLDLAVEVAEHAVLVARAVE